MIFAGQPQIGGGEATPTTGGPATKSVRDSAVRPSVAIADWRCAGCDARIRGDEQGLPAFCPFCMAWAQWRRRGDELWARAISGWEDDGGPEVISPVVMIAPPPFNARRTPWAGPLRPGRALA